MLSRLLTVALALLSSATALEQQPITSDYSLSSTIRDTLKDNEVIGDVLDDFEPSFYLDLAYPKYHETVLLGNDIPVKHVQERPVFIIQPIHPSIESPRENATFTLALTDPDAKSRANPKWSEMCHWLVTNITATSSRYQYGMDNAPTMFKTSGELEEYKPPGPPPKTGAHRYVFVLLRGSSNGIAPPKERRHWGYGKPRHGVRDWAKENGLEVVGANFFFAQDKKQ
jgi:phosphatidylethanolamine-binding protein